MYKNRIVAENYFKQFYNNEILKYFRQSQKYRNTLCGNSVIVLEYRYKYFLRLKTIF